MSFMILSISTKGVTADEFMCKWICISYDLYEQDYLSTYLWIGSLKAVLRYKMWSVLAVVYCHDFKLRKVRRIKMSSIQLNQMTWSRMVD